jgi:delta-aminolevulinic acid dehydratase/porphobilinogen synthase
LALRLVNLIAVLKRDGAEAILIYCAPRVAKTLKGMG